MAKIEKGLLSDIHSINVNITTIPTFIQHIGQ